VIRNLQNDEKFVPLKQLPKGPRAIFSVLSEGLKRLSVINVERGENSGDYSCLAVCIKKRPTELHLTDIIYWGIFDDRLCEPLAKMGVD